MNTRSPAARRRSSAFIGRSQIYRDARSMIAALPCDREIFESGRFRQHVDERFGILPASTWPKTVFKTFRETCRKVARGEMRGVPRKLVAQIKEMATGSMLDQNGKRVRVSAETLASLAALFMAASQIGNERIATATVPDVAP